MKFVGLLPAPVRSGLKRFLRTLGSAPWFRPAGMALVRAWNRKTFRILDKTPGIREVYVRGSYVRGPFVPLASDIDLALVLTDEAARSLDSIRGIHDAMSRVRRTNPSLRDWWSHMIAESELAVVKSMSALYGTADWRDEHGRATAPHDDWADERLLRAAAWAQLCMWSGSAFHAFLYPEGRIHDFAAGIKKSFRFANQMKDAGAGIGGGANIDIDSEHGRLDALVRLFHAIEQGASLWNVAAPGGNGGDSAVDDERHAASVDTVTRTERAHFHVIGNGSGEAALRERLRALRAAPPPEKIVTYVVPASAFAVWPFPAESIEEGEPPAVMPAALAREIHLFEAIYLPSALRLAPAFPDAESRLRRIVSSLERANRIYGRPAGEAEDARDPDARTLFDRGAGLVETLQPALLAFARDRRERT